MGINGHSVSCCRFQGSPRDSEMKTGKFDDEQEENMKAKSRNPENLRVNSLEVDKTQKQEELLVIPEEGPTPENNGLQEKIQRIENFDEIEDPLKNNLDTKSETKKEMEILDKRKLLVEYQEKYKNTNLLENQSSFEKNNLDEYNIDKAKIEELYKEAYITEELFINNEEKGFFYSGQINQSNLFHGYGKLQKYNGEIYEGYFDNGVFQPFGRYTNQNGEIYEGNFENGKIHGFGKLVKKNKQYKGEFYYGMRNGKGKETGGGEEYVGGYKVDYRDGTGNLTFLKTGNVYIGDFKEGKMTGQCKFIWKNGDFYEGGIVNGLFQGKGHYKWHEGMEYDGEYEKGVRNGNGTYKWSEGSVYKGEFSDNMPHGNGILIDNNKTYDITFEKGKPVRKIPKK